MKKNTVKAFPLKIKTLGTTCYHLGWPDSIQTISPLSGQSKHGQLSMACRLWWKALCFEYVLGPWPDSYLWMQRMRELAVLSKGCEGEWLKAVKNAIKQQKVRIMLILPDYCVTMGTVFLHLRRWTCHCRRTLYTSRFFEADVPKMSSSGWQDGTIWLWKFRDIKSPSQSPHDICSLWVRMCT